MPWAVAGAVVGGIAANRAANTAADAQDRATAANAYQGEIAKDQYEDYKNTYRPLEHQMVADAENSDTPDMYAKAAGDAQATVNSQLGLAQDRLARTSGLDPSSAASEAANADMQIRGAAMGATTQNSARNLVKQQAWAKKMDALGLGKGLVTNASNGLASASRGANEIAAATGAQAAKTASSVGSLFSGGVKALSNLNWGGSTSADSSDPYSADIVMGGTGGANMASPGAAELPNLLRGGG